jgi:crotonyl-CoA carboxylase/reductase
MIDPCAGRTVSFDEADAAHVTDEADAAHATMGRGEDVFGNVTVLVGAPASGLGGR